ncbi:MAG: hypothetical protein RL217_898 [Pseudomonadota bacterium]|jgi:hypothetical protein
MNKAFVTLGLILIPAISLAKKTDIELNKIIAVHQIGDESKAGFDFFSADYVHECGGKSSNRFRSYSRYDGVTDRKFTLVLTAFSDNLKLSVETLGCEGNAMKVGRIGVKR